MLADAAPEPGLSITSLGGLGLLCLCLLLVASAAVTVILLVRHNRRGRR